MRIGRYMDIAPKTRASAGTDAVKDPEDLSTDQVRQGVTGHGVRYVLGISLFTALIALAVVWVVVI
jgi:hypothetical protein